MTSKSVDIPESLEESLSVEKENSSMEIQDDIDERKIPSIKELKGTPEWGPNATIGDHLWIATSLTGDFCYVGDSECLKVGNRFKCAACNMICHEQCINILTDQHFICKPSFRDVGVRQYREQTIIEHHWVHRRSEKGKCQHCLKSFQSKLSFSSKDVVAVSCSWCKAAFHNKESCFNILRIGVNCDLGAHSSIIVPPSWIVKLPKQGSFKSSLKNVPQVRRPSKRKLGSKDTGRPLFVIKPIPSTTVTPVIVFINPKSGGNQGIKLLQKFQWLLNPRQVFDLTQGGPKFGLELFRKVPNLRVLACGGDGTVGWILSVIDQIQMNPAPPVGVLPLGTGNDLARALGWGGGYTDEPISKILTNISQSDTVRLDRWYLKVEKNANVDESSNGKDNLPLDVLNNYYSLGVDAHIALEFHEAREAHPERFNSRLRNKMFYGQMGGKDLLLRKWKDLADYVTLECDGVDISPKLKELRVHAIVFLNIGSYGGGTKPWTKGMGTSDPSTEDGIIEVLGLTTYQLPLLQAGGHGSCITQCRTAKIITTKTIPMQVDGEACKLQPSVIIITHLNTASMLAKKKIGRVISSQAALDHINYDIYEISKHNYENYNYDKEKLIETAAHIGNLEIAIKADLESARMTIDRLLEERNVHRLEWCFVDSCTAERFFRIDKAQENLHYVIDVATDNLFILQCGNETVSKDALQDETAYPSPSSRSSLIIPDNIRSCDERSLDSLSENPALLPNQIIEQEVNKGISSIMLSNGLSRNKVCKSEDLITAAKAGNLLMVKKLHSYGISLMIHDATGQTALHYAARYGHRNIIRYILFHQAELVDFKDIIHGQTALHKATTYGWRDICCMLVASGATINLPDHKGITSVMLALKNDHIDLAAYLSGQQGF